MLCVLHTVLRRSQSSYRVERNIHVVVMCSLATVSDPCYLHALANARLHRATSSLPTQPVHKAPTYLTTSVFLLALLHTDVACVHGAHPALSCDSRFVFHMYQYAHRYVLYINIGPGRQAARDGKWPTPLRR